MGRTLGRLVKDICIVSYDKSIDLFLLQLETLDKYLVESNIHLVINESDTTNFIARTKNRIDASVHNFILYSRNDIIGETSLSGWRSQQLIKLLMPLNEWYVLDDKDLFLKKIKFSDLKKRQRLNYMSGDMFVDFFENVKKVLHCEYRIEDTPINWTPNFFEKKVIDYILKAFKGKDNLIKFFEKDTPAEFLLYHLASKILCTDTYEKMPENYIKNVYTQEDYDNLILTDVHILKCHNKIFLNNKQHLRRKLGYE